MEGGRLAARPDPPRLLTFLDKPTCTGSKTMQIYCFSSNLLLHNPLYKPANVTVTLLQISYVPRQRLGPAKHIAPPSFPHALALPTSNRSSLLACPARHCIDAALYVCCVGRCACQSQCGKLVNEDMIMFVILPAVPLQHIFVLSLYLPTPEYFPHTPYKTSHRLAPARR